MNIALWVLLIIGLIAAYVFGGYRLVAKKIANASSPTSGDNKSISSHEKILEIVSSPEIVSKNQDEETLELLLRDGLGKVLIQTRELIEVPSDAQRLQGEGRKLAIHQGTQLAMDIFKGVATLPNKTIEIIFDPRVQEALNEGVYEIVPAVGGGTRAMAREVASKQFTGHGRVVEGGRLKQLGAGTFQLVSIVVAQAHMAEINSNLLEIKGGIEKLQQFLEGKDRAKLKGDIAYLEEIVAEVSRLSLLDKITPEKRGQLEHLRREAMAWEYQLQDEAKNILTRIFNQKDVDSMGGTESTYKALSDHANSIKGLIEKRELVLRLIALLNVIYVYLYPLCRKEALITLGDESQIALLAFEEITLALRDKANQLLSKAVWNKEETLQERRELVVSESKNLLSLANKGQSRFDSSICLLERHADKMTRADNQIKLALSFDKTGSVRDVVLIN